MASDAERRIRDKAVTMLRNRGGGRICHELVLREGFSRIDLALVKADSFELVEIKSEKDVLDRLENQLSAAQKVCRNIGLVFNEKQEGAILEWFKGKYSLQYGVTLYRESEAREFLEPIYLKYFGGKHDKVLCSEALFKLLWAEEMAQALRDLGLIRNTVAHPTRHKMTLIAINELPQKELMKIVCEALRGRRFAVADEVGK